MEIEKEMEMLHINVQCLPINITASNLNQRLNIQPSASSAEQFRIPPKPTLEHKHPAIDFEQQKRHRCFERLLQHLAQSALPEKEVVKLYLQHKYRQQCRASTLQLVYTSIKFFLQFIQQKGKITLQEVTRQDVEAFIEVDQDRGSKITTVRFRLMTLNTFFRFLVDEGRMQEKVLAHKIRLKLPDVLPRAIDPDCLKQLICSIAHVRDRALILLLLRTGMRIGELLNTRVQDIVIPEKKILIYEARKTGIGRVVYFSDDALQALEQWLQKRDATQPFLFYSKQNIRLTYAAARSIFMKHVRKSGLPSQGYTLHRLRHSFASELLNAGMRLECLQPLLGHTHIEMTRRYARLTDKSREEEYFRAMAIIEQEGIDGHY
jgi:integrase/recombinase XerC/integrase/recombinase XerD